MNEIPFQGSSTDSVSSIQPRVVEAYALQIIFKTRNPERQDAGPSIHEAILASQRRYFSGEGDQRASFQQFVSRADDGRNETRRSFTHHHLLHPNSFVPFLASRLTLTHPTTNRTYGHIGSRKSGRSTICLRARTTVFEPDMDTDRRRRRQTPSRRLYRVPGILEPRRGSAEAS